MLITTRKPPGTRESGQVLILIAVVMLVLLAFVALAIDMGRAYIERRNAQSAADSAAFAAAVAKIRNQDSMTLVQLQAAIRSAANSAASKDGFQASTVTANYPPIRPGKPYDGDNNYIQVIIQSNFATFFESLFGRNQIENTSEAVVFADGHASLLGEDLIWGANLNADKTITTNGNVTVNLSNGNMYDASASHAAFTTVGASGNINVTNGKIYIVGGATTGTTVINPAPITGVTAKNYPIVPAPDCSVRSNFPANPNYHSSGKATINNNTTLNPGNYSGIKLTSSNITLVLNPGLYCLTADFTTNSGAMIVGNGVMLAFFNGAILDLGGASSVTLSAPLPPFIKQSVTPPNKLIDYAGLLVYANPADYTSPTGSFNPNTTFQLNGNVTTDITGTMYLPTADCSLQGNSGINSINTQLICNRVSIGGGGNSSVDMSLDSANPFDYGGNIKLMQ